MVRYFTKEFFEEIARRLNADPEWSRKAGGLAVKLVLTCTDRSESFLLELKEGQVDAAPAQADTPADFKFEGPYDAWVLLGKGERDFQSLVISGKIKFRGSLPKIMGMMGQLNRVTQTAQQIPKDF